jgi:subtilase family protein
MGLRHPAVYPKVVAVAAVTGKDNETEAARYSNMADPDHGIATPVNPQVPGLPVAPTPTNCMTGATNIDAHIGVYTSLTYPRLFSPEPPNIIGDCHETYPAHQPDNYWAYWSGTSFSTSIISALVARILEKMGPGTKLSSQQVISTINSPAVITDSPLPFNDDLQSHVLDIGQCQDGGVVE